jgi:iron complex transport system substrate-binding protein
MKRSPSVPRDIARAVAVITLAAAPPVWAGSIIDQRSQEISVESPQKMVTLGAATTETVIALGLGERIIAADASSKGIEGAADKSTLGYHRQVAAEGVLATGTDLVVATAAAGPPAALEQIESAGIPLVVLEQATTVDATIKRIETLGTLLDAREKADAIVAAMQTDLAEAAQLKQDPPVRVLFLYARGGGAGQMAGDETIANAMINLAGGVNAFAGTKGYTAVTPEAVVTANPDVVLLTTGGLASLGGETGIWSTPGLAQLPRESVRLISMDDHLLLGFGPRTGVAALELAKRLQTPSSSSKSGGPDAQ